MPISTYKAAKDFIQAMVGLVGKGFVSKEEANRRSEICAQCHNNVSDPGCTGCRAKGVKMARDLLLKGRSTPNDGALKSCKICGCDNAASVHFPLASFGYVKDDSNAWPAFCWKKDVEKENPT